MICKQPNGLFCRFSSVIDDVVYGDMTFDDYVELIESRGKTKEEAIEEANDIFKNHLKEFEFVLEHFSPNCSKIEDFKAWCREVGYTGTFDKYEKAWYSNIICNIVYNYSSTKYRLYDKESIEYIDGKYVVKENAISTEPDAKTLRHVQEQVDDYLCENYNKVDLENFKLFLLNKDLDKWCVISTEQDD